MRLSIIGFGAVGQGFARVLEKKQDYLKSIGIDLVVVAVADSHGVYVDLSGIDLGNALKMKKESGSIATSDISSLDLIKDIDHDLVVEATPTNIDHGEPGLTNMLEAFRHGKHVVTSNKGPLSLRYEQLCTVSKNNNVAFKFEATVGGAMPIINLSQISLAGNRIISIAGILNGTCNYILSRMTEEFLSYKQALEQAQELGIAESDPSYDVEGIDTACKLVILANAIFTMNVEFNDVEITGITGIIPEALSLAEAENKVIRLIGEVKDGNERILRVAPRLIPRQHPLAAGGTMNVALINTDMAGPICISGIGAGSIETASAILSDIIAIITK